MLLFLCEALSTAHIIKKITPGLVKQLIRTVPCFAVCPPRFKPTLHCIEGSTRVVVYPALSTSLILCLYIKKKFFKTMKNKIHKLIKMVCMRHRILTYGVWKSSKYLPPKSSSSTNGCYTNYSQNRLGSLMRLLEYNSRKYSCYELRYIRLQFKK